MKNRQQKVTALFVGTILLAAAWIPESWAQSKDVASISTSTQNVRENHPASEDAHQQKLSVDLSAPLSVALSGSLDLSPKTEGRGKQNGLYEWLRTFLLDIKVTDCLLVGFTGLLWWTTRNLWRATNNLHVVAIGQADDMKSSIAESARAANAMEKVAESICISAQAATESVQTSKGIAERQKIYGQMQLRAYLSVIINTGVYQDEKLKFEVKPLVVNNGNTPANKLRYWAKADVFPFPLPENFSFPSGEEPKVGSILGAHQNVVLNAIVDKTFSTDEVKEIKLGIHKRLYIWGRVIYEDAFGETHYTNFAHSIYWVKVKKGEAVMGNYTYQHNEAT